MELNGLAYEREAIRPRLSYAVCLTITRFRTLIVYHVEVVLVRVIIIHGSPSIIHGVVGFVRQGEDITLFSTLVRTYELLTTHYLIFTVKPQ